MEAMVSILRPLHPAGLIKAVGRSVVDQGDDSGGPDLTKSKVAFSEGVGEEMASVVDDDTRPHLSFSRFSPVQHRVLCYTAADLPKFCKFQANT